jgi:cytochrome c oxidase assembly protein subunit 15
MFNSFIDKKFIQVSAITLVLLYMVILAGSIVRATDSGMGCPDWPKCFGYYIPPTHPSQVKFHYNHVYQKNTLIIRNDTLWRAKNTFTSATTFDYNNWEKYPAHDYAQFFVYKTWIEYINRLVGALNAFSMILLFVFSLFRIKKDKQSFFIISAAMLVMAFVIWLGAVVVSTNLAPQKISFHMISSIILLAAVIYSNNRAKQLAGVFVKNDIAKSLRYLLWIALLLTTAQILFGTQVRQQIDGLQHSDVQVVRSTWLSHLNYFYSVHQITAMLLVLLNILMYIKFRKYSLDNNTHQIIKYSLIVILLEYAAGFVLHKLSVPPLVQPVHLFFALLLFGLQFALLCRTKQSD